MEDSTKHSDAGKRQKITVCILTYNHERYIADCLSSVVAQQVDADLEILVGEDCSRDKTREIIAQFARRYPDLIFPLLHEKNLGAGGNCRALMARASGDYIAHMDGDDFWMPGKLQAQLAFLQSHPRCGAVYSNAAVIDDTGKFVSRFNRAVVQEFDLDFLIGEGNFLCYSSLLYRRECRERLLRIDGDFIDYMVHVEIAGGAMLGYVNRDLTVYRVNSLNSMSSGMPEHVTNLYWSAVMRAVQLGVSRTSLRSCLVGRCRSLLRTALVRRLPGVAWRQYRRMSAQAPLFMPAVVLRAAVSLPYYLARDLWHACAPRIVRSGPHILYDR